MSLVMASAVQDEVRSGALVALPIPGLEKRLQLIWRKPPGNLHPPVFVRHLLADSYNSLEAVISYAPAMPNLTV